MDLLNSFDDYHKQEKKNLYRGIILPDGRFFLPDNSTGYSCAGFSKSGHNYIFRMTQFKDLQTGKALSAPDARKGYSTYTLEYLDLSGKCLLKFDNVYEVYSEVAYLGEVGYDVILTATMQYNEAQEENEYVFTYYLVNHQTLKWNETWKKITEYDDYDFTYNQAEFNGITCPYISMEGVTRLYNLNLEMLTEIFGRIVYTFTANHKLYTVNRIEDSRMGLSYTAVYNVNDDRECFRADSNNKIRILLGDEGRFRYYINDLQVSFASSPAFITHKGKQTVLFVCTKCEGENTYQGIVDSEGRVVVPFEYKLIDFTCEGRSWGSLYTLPKNHILLTRDSSIFSIRENQISLCDPEGNIIIKDLDKGDFDRKLVELFPECIKRK